MTGLAIGEHVRCFCGSVLSVQPAAPLPVKPLTCTRCGGTFDEGATHCPYCQGGIALEDRRLSALCRRCGLRTASGASFCASCGTNVGGQALSGVRAKAGCPRCRAELRTRVVASAEANTPLASTEERDATRAARTARDTNSAHEVIECSSCGGVWLGADQLDRLCAERERDGAFARALSVPRPLSPEAATSVAGYVACVTCREPMHRRNFGGASGIVLDHCRDHGVWLDHGELARVLAWVRAGGLERSHERELVRRRAERERTTALGRGAVATPLPFERDPAHSLDVEDALLALLSLAARALGFGRK